MDYVTTAHERENLEAHVDLCAVRYHHLEKRLESLENSVNEIKKDVVEGQKSLKKTIIATSGSIIVAILTLIGSILMLYLGK